MISRGSTIGLLVLAGALPTAFAQAPSSASAVGSGSQTSSAPQAEIKTYAIPSGTKMLLSLKNEISTRSAMPGDPVYFDSVFPVVENGVVVLPAGMYVRGFVESVQRPGRVKGRAQLQLRFATMIFPNGVEIALSGSLDNASSSDGAKVVSAEGAVTQGKNKGQDTQRIAASTLEGAGVGSLIGDGTGHVGAGAGIGAGAGAALGVLTTLFARGNDVVIQPGTTVEMALSRPVVIQQAQLAGMPAYTGVATPTPAGPQPSAQTK
jgi:hypothetical protein